MLDSPARQEIAKRILSGGSAVWLFVGGGDEPRDAMALAALTNQLAQLEKELKLPDEQGEINPNTEVRGALPLQIAFPVVTVNRNDPLESSFVRMLENASMPPLPRGTPHVFLFFGKGRVMKGVADEGLTPEAIRKTCDFMVQNCSCMVKDQLQQMSFHVPLAADWRPMDSPPAQLELTVPSLAGPRPMRKPPAP